MENRANAAKLIRRLEEAKIINLDVSARTLVDAVESLGDIDPGDLICYPYYWHPPRLGDREVLQVITDLKQSVDSLKGSVDQIGKQR